MKPVRKKPAPEFSPRLFVRSNPSLGCTLQSRRRWAQNLLLRLLVYKRGIAQKPFSGSNSIRRTECGGTPSRDRQQQSSSRLHPSPLSGRTSHGQKYEAQNATRNEFS